MVVLQPRLQAAAILSQAILQPAARFPKPRGYGGEIEIVHRGATSTDFRLISAG
jgi:hypothetical protein